MAVDRWLRAYVQYWKKKSLEERDDPWHSDMYNTYRPRDGSAPDSAVSPRGGVACCTTESPDWKEISPVRICL